MAAHYGENIQGKVKQIPGESIPGAKPPNGDHKVTMREETKAEDQD